MKAFRPYPLTGGHAVEFWASFLGSCLSLSILLVVRFPPMYMLLLISQAIAICGVLCTQISPHFWVRTLICLALTAGGLPLLPGRSDVAVGVYFALLAFLSAWIGAKSISSRRIVLLGFLAALPPTCGWLVLYALL